jgi:acyl-CoA thioesterase-1
MRHGNFLARYAALAAVAFGILLAGSPAAFAASINIVVIGDSNIAGKGVSSSETYPSRLERALRAKGYDVRVANEGINGDTVPGVASRADSAVPPGTKLAIVWVGINDLRAGVPAGKVEQGRQAIAAHLRARGIKVLLLGPRHGLAGQPQYLTGDRQQHLNAAGYDVIVARTIGRVQALIGRR